RVLNEAGVVCGPIYTMAEIFEDPQYRAREMLVERVDPEFGPYLGPGVVPKFSETPGEVQWSGTWEDGSHNEEIYCGLLGLTDSELGGLREDGVVCAEAPSSPAVNGASRSATSVRATGCRTSRSRSSRPC